MRSGARLLNIRPIYKDDVKRLHVGGGIVKSGRQFAPNDAHQVWRRLLLSG